MIEKKTVCICDICGKTVDAVPKAWQYNETEYFPPDDWREGVGNTDVDICPEYSQNLSRPRSELTMREDGGLHLHVD